MSDDPVGYRQPPKQSQFARGKSGNPRGRPRKKERHLLTRQARADILHISEETCSVKTARGAKTISRMELYFRTVEQRALAGNPTAMKLWGGFLMSALKERAEAHGPVRLLEGLLDYEDRSDVRLQNFEDPDYDLKKMTRDLY